MTVWAMIIVEVVHPLVKDLHINCEDCLRSTSSVMEANLLLFRTVIAGDSWGDFAVPVIEAFPATSLIFVGSYLTIVFGVLNLIVAVVDSWQQVGGSLWHFQNRYSRQFVTECLNIMIIARAKPLNCCGR